MPQDSREPRAGPDGLPAGEFRAVVERYEDAPDQCTIYPGDSDDRDRMTSWITARDPAFVDLRMVR